MELGAHSPSIPSVSEYAYALLSSTGSPLCLVAPYGQWPSAPTQPNNLSISIWRALCYLRVARRNHLYKPRTRAFVLQNCLPLHAGSDTVVMDSQLPERKRKVKSILVSQPESQAGNSPYLVLAEKHKLKIDFRPFIEVVGVNAAEFRKDKIALGEFKSFIFSSRNAIDHFFRMCEEMRVAINPDWKYFCTSEAVAFYLQKFVPYRKRKIYPAKSNIADLVPTLKKQRGEHFLMPTSDVLNPDVPAALAAARRSLAASRSFCAIDDDTSTHSARSTPVFCAARTTRTHGSAAAMTMSAHAATSSADGNHKSRVRHVAGSGSSSSNENGWNVAARARAYGKLFLA